MRQGKTAGNYDPVFFRWKLQLFPVRFRNASAPQWWMSSWPSHRRNCCTTALKHTLATLENLQWELWIWHVHDDVFLNYSNRRNTVAALLLCFPPDSTTAEVKNGQSFINVHDDRLIQIHLARPELGFFTSLVVKSMLESLSQHRLK